MKDDSRVTKSGHILRNTHIDELPQLFNVLKGDISLVGNRPLEHYEVERLLAQKQTLRFLAPAGITGLWQVRQYKRQEFKEKERIMFDNFYALKQSFCLDLYILVQTVAVLFKWKKVGKIS
ncbi:lipopolysaccharide/colanic/teichoic acid biosynthesis glycosyltransferase [Pedobacter sp. AK017]|nr:lipopolysaccharide/colanic/teichoic acid biosynthesis glycosyltransferase [Pedobacter sp. AK017]